MPNKGDAGPSSDNADKTIDQDGESLVYYPAYCFKASSTWFTWVKLTAYQIHHQLCTRDDFQVPPSIVGTDNGWRQSPTQLLFYLNHPIQFIQLVGVIVAFEDYFEKFWLFTLDDSSGATIEVNCRKPVAVTNASGGENSRSKEQEKQKQNQALYATMHRLDIGVVVQVKGQITIFRDTRQLQLERVFVLRDTNEELRLIDARTNFFERVLTAPWKMSGDQQRKLYREAHDDNEEQIARRQKRRKLLQAKVEREKQYTAQIQRRYEQEEQLRAIDAQEASDAGKVLEEGQEASKLV